MSLPTDVLNAARLAADILATLVPRPVAEQLLSEAAIKRQNAIADAAEAAKFVFSGPLSAVPSADDEP
jgi:hypothetical protein